MVRSANLAARPAAGDGDLRDIVPHVGRTPAADLGAPVERVSDDAADLAQVDLIRVHAPIIEVELVDNHAVAPRIAVVQHVAPLVDAGGGELLLFDVGRLRDDGQAPRKSYTP